MSINRKLGRLEQVIELLNSHARTWNLVTISRLNKPLKKEILRQAIDITQLRHPRLNSRIVRSRNHLYFQTEGTPRLELRVVNKVSTEQWQEVVHEEMNEIIDSSTGLLRVVLVNILSNNLSYLITTAHHAITDGLSCAQLHSEILTYYQKIVSNDPINSDTKLPALPPPEELLPKWTKGFKGKINSWFLFSKLIIQKIWYQPKTLGFEKYLPIANRYSDIIHRQFNQDLTQKFVNRCRQENTTVHSALCTLMMFITAGKIIRNNKKNLCVNCLSYIDLRRRLSPAISEENLSVLATSMMGFHTIKINTSFWELAREVKQKLEAGINQGDMFNMVLIAKQLIDFCFIFPHEVAATVSVSNIGQVQIPKTYGELELEEISFASSHALYAGVFIIHASTFQGKMLLNFVFSQPAISRHKMEDLVNKFMSFIDDVCNLPSISFNSFYLRGI
jgi:NRPS condensation-like uncharacterized protein